MSVPEIARESRDSLYGLHRLTLALLKERSTDDRPLVQTRVRYEGRDGIMEMTATIELSEMQFMLDRLFEAAEREDDPEHVDIDIDDVLGIWPNMTGGKSIEDYIDSSWEEG